MKIDDMNVTQRQNIKNLNSIDRIGSILRIVILESGCCYKKLSKINNNETMASISVFIILVVKLVTRNILNIKKQIHRTKKEK